MLHLLHVGLLFSYRGGGGAGGDGVLNWRDYLFHSLCLVLIWRLKKAHKEPSKVKLHKFKSHLMLFLRAFE